jgi:isopenicillin N synthase-like dioxygenase
MNQVQDIKEIHDFFQNKPDLSEIPASIRNQCEIIVEHFLRYKYCLFAGHDIPPELILDAYRCSHDFFHSSVDDKLSCLSKDRARRGYTSENSENFASLIGDMHRPNDMVEKYRIGPVRLEADATSEEYYSSKEGRIYFYPNAWPTAIIPSFESTISSYYQAIEQFTLLILRIIETGMNLLEDVFTSQMDKHTSILSMNYYRGIDELSQTDYDNRKIEADRIIRVAKHKDVSMLTVVTQCSKIGDDFISCDSSSGGLELFVEDPSDQNWQTIAEPFTTLIVHIGDCLEDWTAERFSSVSHRVTSTIGPASLERYSLAYFASPNHDALMNLQGRDSGSQADKESMTYARWRKQHIKKACSIQRQNLVP